MSWILDCVRRVGMLSKDDLVLEVQRLVKLEKAHAAQVIAHLAEIRRRKLYVDLGYPNLYAYCRKGLELDEREIPVRVQVAGVCLRFPRVLELLASNRMSMSVVALVAPVLTPENAAEVLAACQGLTCRAVKEYLVALKPKPVVTSGIRRAPGNAPAQSNDPSGPDVDPLFDSPLDSQPEGSHPDPDSSERSKAEPHPGKRKRRGRVEPAKPDVFNARFPMTAQLKAKLARLAEIQNVWNFEANLAELVEQAVDIALEKKDPRQRLERRRKRRAKQETDSARANDVDAAESAPNVSDGSDRYVPAGLRDEVIHRAQYRCEFVSDHGKRCEERTRLEIDHIEPFARGGATTADNLRCLCRVHNLRYAERSYGIAFMQEKIIASQHNRNRLGA